MSKFQSYTKPWIKKEPFMAKKKRAHLVLKRLSKAYPQARMMLTYRTDFELAVAVMLSAQCTDKKVNEITPALFKKYPTIHSFAKAKQKDVERLVYQTGFYRNKARNIIAAAKKIERDFAGKLPDTMADILTIPGIARKSANVILGNAHGVVEGIAVDTHVARLAQRWGFTASDKPIFIERDLIRLIPKKEWFLFTYKTIEHGRAICTSQRKKCELCPLKDLCPSSLATQKE